MEKKGDLFNQLAIVSELLEKINVESRAQTIILEVPEKEFYRIYKMVEYKVGFVTGKPQDTFNIRIGDVNIVFNMSNV
jgi:hypothetical protein